MKNTEDILPCQFIHTDVWKPRIFYWRKQNHVQRANMQQLSKMQLCLTRKAKQPVAQVIRLQIQPGKRMEPHASASALQTLTTHCPLSPAIALLLLRPSAYTRGRSKFWVIHRPRPGAPHQGAEEKGKETGEDCINQQDLRASTGTRRPKGNIQQQFRRTRAWYFSL